MENIFCVCDAAIITSPSNLFYFTGYSNADAVVVLTKNKKYYITDKRSIEESSDALSDWSIIDTGSNPYLFTAMGVINSLKCINVGYENNTILHADFISIENYTTALQTLVDISKEIDELRSIKNSVELATIIKAQEITDKVFSAIQLEAKAGISEIELASKLNAMIYSNGATLAFDTIVAFGENTSKPHSHPTLKILQENDVVLIDFGAKYNGYCSDMTRSFAVGCVSSEYETMYNHVLQAQLIAINGIKAGMTGKECDSLARDYFKKQGLEAYFTHSLGHSLGVDIHESPNFSPRCDDSISENAVLSIEPGLYFEGKFGIRIEDIVIVKKTTVENLTNSLKPLIIV